MKRRAGATGTKAAGTSGAAGTWPPRPLAFDQRRGQEVRTAACGAVALVCALTVIDAASGGLAPLRAVYWAALALLLYALVRPPRVAAGDGWLTVRGLLTTRTVRTDLLISVRCRGGAGSRLVFDDLLGGRVRLDPRVLTGSPLLWHHVDAGVRAARAQGCLRNGTRELQSLADHIDEGGARGIFRASGLG